MMGPCIRIRTKQRKMQVIQVKTRVYHCTLREKEGEEKMGNMKQAEVRYDADGCLQRERHWNMAPCRWLITWETHIKENAYVNVCLEESCMDGTLHPHLNLVEHATGVSARKCGIAHGTRKMGKTSNVHCLRYGMMYRDTCLSVHLEARGFTDG